MNITNCWKKIDMQFHNKIYRNTTNCCSIRQINKKSKLDKLSLQMRIYYMDSWYGIQHREGNLIGWMNV